MVKFGDKVEIGQLRLQFEELVRNLVQRVPFLELESLTSEAPFFSSKQGQLEKPNWQADVRAKDRHWTFLVECKRIGQPREVRNGVLQLRNFLEQLPKEKPAYGLLVAPFISEESARLCEEAGVGYADLAGNARLSFDQVFIETRSP